MPTGQCTQPPATSSHHLLSNVWKTSFSLSCSFEATDFPSKVLNFVFMAFLSVTWRMGTWSEFNLKIHGFFLGKPMTFVFPTPLFFRGQKRSSPKISSDVTWTLSSFNSKGRLGKLDQLHSLNQVMSPANSGTWINEPLEKVNLSWTSSFSSFIP